MADSVSIAQEIETELRKAITYLTGDDDLMKADPKTPFKDLGLDSMMAIEIMAVLEKKFKIELQEKDVVRFTTIEATVKILLDYMK